MVLVTGGTGLVGSHLLYFLANAENKIKAIHRKTSNLRQVEKVFTYYTTPEKAKVLFSKITWVEADILDITSLTEAFKAVEFVYHCAAFIHFDPKKYTALKKVNVEGTANVVNLALLHKVKKLCYVSSIATLGSTKKDALITEETYFNHDANNSVYALTKHAAEMEVWRGTQEGLPAVIVNPGVIFGSGFWDSGSGVLLKIAARGIPIYTHGTMGFVDIKDVVKSMKLLMESTIINQRYVLVGDNISYKDLLTQMAFHFNKKPPRKYIAKWKLLTFSKIDWLTNKLFGTKRKLLQATVHSLYTNTSYSTTKIEKDLGVQFTPFTKTLTRVIKHYKIVS